MYTTTPTQFKSVENFLAYEQLKDDYKNLAIYYEDCISSQEGSKQKIKAINNCKRYLNRIIKNKTILGFDSDADQNLLDTIN